MPGGFIPTQDKLYLIGGVKLPEGASLDRAPSGGAQDDASWRCETDGVEHAVAFPGLNRVAVHQHAEHRRRVLRRSSRSTSATAAPQEINAEINAKFAGIQEGFAFAIMPPPILGLGNGSGYSLYRRRTAPALGYGALAERGERAVRARSRRRRAWASRSAPTRPTCRSSTRRSTASRPRRRACALTDLFDTLQTYLGSAYVNDFNRFGRTFRVLAQADGPFRDERRGHRQSAHAQRQRARWCRSARMVAIEPDLRPRSGDALQRLSGRRPASARPIRGCCRRRRRWPTSSAIAPPRCCPTA